MLELPCNASSPRDVDVNGGDHLTVLSRDSSQDQETDSESMSLNDADVMSDIGDSYSENETRDDSGDDDTFDELESSSISKTSSIGTGKRTPPFAALFLGSLGFEIDPEQSALAQHTSAADASFNAGMKTMDILQQIDMTNMRKSPSSVLEKQEVEADVELMLQRRSPSSSNSDSDQSNKVSTFLNI